MNKNEKQYLCDAFLQAVIWAAEDRHKDGPKTGLSTQNSDVAKTHNKLMDNDSYRNTFYKYSDLVGSDQNKEFSQKILAAAGDDVPFMTSCFKATCLIASNVLLMAKLHSYEHSMLRYFKRSLE